jgi:hypothetical protein
VLKVEKIKDYAIRGIVPKKEYSLPVTIGEVSCIFLDKEERTKRNKSQSLSGLFQ